jgi:rhamnogalacturonan endolyase
MKRLMLCAQVIFATITGANEMNEPVTLQMGEKIMLDNGLVQLGIREDGNLQELSLHGGPNLASSGYWNSNGNGYDEQGAPIRQKFAVLAGQAKIVRQSDELVEVAFVREPAAPFFFRTALHYVLRRGESGFYIYMTAAHDAQMPAGSITQYAYNLRLAPQYFDYIAVDEERRHISHSIEDEAAADQVMDATFGLADGRVVSKYDYSHAIEDDDFNLYGWAGSQAGVWWIQASGEYYGSAPFRVLLTSHQTAKTPIIIWQAHCTHRGGYEIEFPPEDEADWKKIYGPAFIYLNAGGDYDALWNDAKIQAATTEEKWPFAWMQHELFPSERGEVTGQLIFDDGTPAVDAWVVLAPEGEHWSQENRGYHFWTRTDAEGRFNVQNVRPGRYALFALGADQFYEFERDGVVVAVGGETALGRLSWQEVARGRRIWQIGTADRSTGEYANGDDFHHWGLWRRYLGDFPQDVNFVIGKSREREDWNFAHWNWYSRNNAWNIVFDLDEESKGKATLTFGIAVARGHNARGFGANDRAAELQVWVNDQQVGLVSIASTGGDSYRSARQSTRYSVREVNFDAELLSRGENAISLRHATAHPYVEGEEKGERGSGPGCIMYDAIRLEIE